MVHSKRKKRGSCSFINDECETESMEFGSDDESDDGCDEYEIDLSIEGEEANDPSFYRACDITLDSHTNTHNHNICDDDNTDNITTSTSNRIIDEVQSHDEDSCHVSSTRGDKLPVMGVDCKNLHKKAVLLQTKFTQFA